MANTSCEKISMYLIESIKFFWCEEQNHHCTGKKRVITEKETDLKFQVIKDRYEFSEKPRSLMHKLAPAQEDVPTNKNVRVLYRY
jgi:hypothetical protein